MASVALAACAAVGGAAAPAAPARVQYGIGDQALASFSDPRFAWLGVRIARLVVPYDTVRYRSELAGARAWLTAARAHGLAPLVMFSHSSQRPKLLPAVSDYRRAVLGFRHLFPWVRDYGTWDEENHVSQPTYRNPAQAARYYNALSAMCGSCTIIAADVLDQPGMARWVSGFLPHARHPHLWGLHNYYDLNHGGHARTSLLLRIVPGTVWLTETGGLVWRWNIPTRRFVVRGEAAAARAARRLRSLAAISPRIQRIYYYHWRIGTTLSFARRHPGRVTWDSGLVRPDCSPRPALSIFAADLGRDPADMPAAVLDPYGNCSPPPPPPPLPTTTADSGSPPPSGTPPPGP